MARSLLTCFACILIPWGLAPLAKAAFGAEQSRSGASGVLRVELAMSESGQVLFVAQGFNADQLAALKVQERREELSSTLSVYVGADEAPDRPPMLGDVRLDGRKLVFEPRFPLEAGLSYRAVLRLSGDPESGGVQTIARAFSIEKPATEPPRVEHVFPSADVLPENLLKFYLHFSRPMSRGEAYRHLRLVEASGRMIEDPFLELGEELWDASGTRFTLFFDPGRIKRGLKPREEIGPALEEGKSYSLVVLADWPDAEGLPLASEFRKSFRVVAPDDGQPNPQSWRLTSPQAGTRDALEVRFPEPLDHAMLLRVLRVLDGSGQRVAGTVEVSERETLWRFTPKEPWRRGDYRLNVDSALEDLAGNSLRRPFEVDVARSVEVQVQEETTSIPFSIGDQSPPVAP